MSAPTWRELAYRCARLVWMWYRAFRRRRRRRVARAAARRRATIPIGAPIAPRFEFGALIPIELAHEATRYFPANPYGSPIAGRAIDMQEDYRRLAFIEARRQYDRRLELEEARRRSLYAAPSPFVIEAPPGPGSE